MKGLNGVPDDLDVDRLLVLSAPEPKLPLDPMFEIIIVESNVHPGAVAPADERHVCGKKNSPPFPAQRMANPHQVAKSLPQTCAFVVKQRPGGINQRKLHCVAAPKSEQKISG